MTQSLVAMMVGLLGLHMLRTALRDRAAVQAWIGLFFVATAVGAECTARAVAPDNEPFVRLRFLYVGVPALTVATISAYAFTYTVFRRGEAWALAIVNAGAVLAAWGAWHQLVGPTGVPETSGLRVEFLLGRVACFAWGTYEAVRAYGMAQRRLALGLGDPVVVNRFLLFGVWFAVMGLMPLTLALMRLHGGAAAQTVGFGIGPQLVGTIMIVSLILTFFPPRTYREWVTASARGVRS